MELPKLTGKENKCLMRFLTNGFKKGEAYRYAYDCSNMNENTIAVESSRFFSSPKITPWLDEFQVNVQETVQEQLNYDALKHFEELNEMKQEAMNCSDKYHNPNVNVALKAVELKGKLAGLYKNDTEDLSGGIVTVMGSIAVDGKKIEYQVGESVNDDSTSKNS